MAANKTQLLPCGVPMARVDLSAWTTCDFTRGSSESRSPQNPLRHKGGIHQWLAALGEIHEIGRTRIRGRVQRRLSQSGKTFLAFFLYFVQSLGLQPRRKAGQQTSERFKVRVLGAICGIGRFDGHHFL